MEAVKLAEEFKIQAWQAENVIALIDEGNTIRFIARYRKEKTGSLDDQILREFADRLDFLRKLEEMRNKVMEAIEKQGNLTDEICQALKSAVTLTEIEDIYRPFKPKRKTRASVARERGLEPLATLIMEQRKSYDKSIEEIAADYIDEEKGVATADDALNGAKDIIAEDISDNAEYRKAIRALTHDNGVIVSKKAKDEDSVYSSYYDYRENIVKIPGHRVLAINRGEKEEFLKVSVEIDNDIILNYLFRYLSQA